MSTGHIHTYNYELTGFDLTAGIFTGLALCAVLQSAVYIKISNLGSKILN